jgi:hypothetical protein
LLTDEGLVVGGGIGMLELKIFVVGHSEDEASGREPCIVGERAEVDGIAGDQVDEDDDDEYGE